MSKTRTLPLDDIIPGIYVTVEQGYFFDLQQGEWVARGQGMYWIGPGPDWRGDLFKVVLYEHPYVVLDLIANQMGQRANPPQRMNMDVRHTKFRQVSPDFAEAMIGKSSLDTSSVKATVLSGDPATAVRSLLQTMFGPGIEVVEAARASPQIEPPKISELSVEPAAAKVPAPKPTMPRNTAAKDGEVAKKPKRKKN